jgi:hypothetical protein
MTTLAIPSLNLMPAVRVAANHRRRRIRNWIIALTTYGAAMAGLWGYCAVRGARAGGVGQELLEVGNRIERLQGELKATDSKLAVAQREMEAAREVRNHPDMSVLLARIAAAAGPQITLDRFEVRPISKVDEKGRKTDLIASQGYTLKLTGLSSDQVDVPRFGKALQDLGIFETVSVLSIRAKEMPVKLNSKGEPIKAIQLFSFDIEGVFSDRGASSSQPAGASR